ncbi:uncharacterized protein LOC121784249 [Salvia splendens]|uniref:uncharacterized protein LOC121784249 n=1 Tax=Salvia splendens TaxID=180675 RepID=UPI001C2577B8|nr:uncharacterized protein LOC121784249 [Salvia splendens]
MGQIFSFMVKSKKENDFFKEKSIEKFGQLEASMRNLETQIGQIATASRTRAPDTILSDTVPNPKGNEHSKAVTLGSERKLDSMLLMDDQDEACKGSPALVQDAQHGQEQAVSGSKEQDDESKLNGRLTAGEKDKKVNETEPKKSKYSILNDIPPPPYPFTRKKRVRQEKSFEWMMNVIRKFFKDMMANNEKLQDEGIVALSTNCSQLISGIMPTKRRDPGGCIIPCEIGNTIFAKCLLDQGSGISLMALKIARAIGLEKRMEPIDITLQLADHSIVKPNGIVEDVLVKIDKFIIPIDFIVLDMPEDKEVPILFGRPFLATGDIFLEAKDNSVTFRINGEQLSINVENAMKHPTDVNACFRVDVLDICIFDKSCYSTRIEGSVFEKGSLERDFGSTFKMNIDDKDEDQVDQSSFEKQVLIDICVADLRPSIEVPPKLKLKPLPNNVKYAFWGKMRPYQL